MNAFRLRLLAPEWSPKPFFALVISDQDANSVKEMAAADGFIVQKITTATADDLAMEAHYAELVPQIKDAIGKRRAVAKRQLEADAAIERERAIGVETRRRERSASAVRLAAGEFADATIENVSMKSKTFAVTRNSSRCFSIRRA